jgi:hypothetical protein
LRFCIFEISIISQKQETKKKQKTGSFSIFLSFHKYRKYTRKKKEEEEEEEANNEKNRTKGE